MTLNLNLPRATEDLKPRITVFGVGGAGGNAVNNMIAKELDGVTFIVANTDAQALAQSAAQSKVQMGVNVTEGLGAGARPTVGAAAAEESIEEIIDHLSGAHMCFITGGMGGGTGTGAAPIIAQAARELGVLTVGVVTKPFQFEGSKRMRQADEGVEALQQQVDTLIIIPNQNLFRLANEKTTFTEAFSMADDVLHQGVKGVTDLMVRPGLMNLDFADIRAVMDEMGKAMMGTGEAEGEDRAIQAAEKAIANPLLDEISLKGARGVLINITGGLDLTLFEIDEAANRIREEVDPDANIIVGSTLDDAMEGTMRVSVVATGIDAAEGTGEVPKPRRKLSSPLRPIEEVEADVVEASAEPEPEPEPEIEEARPAARVRQPEPAAPARSAEPALFDEPAPRESRGSFFDTDDDLPAPAYRPEPREAEATQAHEAPRHEDEPRYEEAAQYEPERPRRSAPVSPPRHATPGEPSAETLSRLRDAVSKVPDGGLGRRPLRNAGRTDQPQRGRAPTAEESDTRPQSQSEADRGGRFKFQSFIDRMTGHPGEEPPRRPAPARTQPPLQGQGGYNRGGQRGSAATDEEPDDDPDGYDVPAFLRRQAN